MNSKSKVLLSSIASIALCSSIAVGGTFALFTSESKVNIAVTSGKVSVTAEAKNLTTYSMDVAQAAGAFQLGGTATLVDNQLTLSLMAPGDKATFDIDLTNESNIDIVYRVVISAEGPLADVLEYTNESLAWTKVKANGEVSDIAVSVELPQEVGNDYQDKTEATTITFLVEAVQGNGDPEGTVAAYTAEEVAKELAKGGEVILMNDVTLEDEALEIPAGMETVLNLNGKTLSANAGINNYGTFTVNNGSITNTNADVSAIQNNNGATLVLNNMAISSARHAVRVEGGNVTINGGEYKTAPNSNKTLHALNVSDGGIVTINGGTFVGPKGTVADSGAAVNVQSNSTVIINGGNFSNGKNNTLASKGTLTVYGGTFDQDPTAWVPANGYTITTENNVWTVKSNASILSNALANGNVTLDGNTDLSEAVIIDETVTATLDLNTYTVNNSLINKGTVTISDGEINIGKAGLENYGNATITNVTMNAGSAADYSNISRAGSETVYNNVTVNSAGGGVGAVGGGKVTFNSGSVEVNSTSTSGRYLFYAEGEGSTITINGGNFDFNKTQNQKRAYIYAGAGTTVYVTGGTFGKASTRSGYTAGILGEGTVIITGGTFGFDPSAWVAEGYQAVESNGVWTVTQK